MQLAAGFTQVDESVQELIIVLERRNRVLTCEQALLVCIFFPHRFFFSAQFTDMLE